MKDGDVNLQSVEETVNCLMSRFFPDDTLQDDTDFHRGLRESFFQLPDVQDDPPFTCSEVRECLSGFDSGKSPGDDHFTSDICLRFFLADSKTVLAMYNACLRVRHFPKVWKTARVLVIPKPGKTDYSDVSAYRPIGLLSVFGKVYEKLIIGRLSWHLHSKGLLSDAQYGFTPQKSTEDALCASITTIKRYMNNRQFAVAISLDIKGAFDNAWWPFLMYQLKKKSCPRNLYQVIISYLDQRTVKITYAGVTLEKVTSRGCIQGSIAGPLFWNIILDDLLASDLGAGVEIRAFADDVLLIVGGAGIDEVQRAANHALRLVSNWGDRVKLHFSEEKTNAMLITRRRKFVLPQIIMKGKSLPLVGSFKILGVTIDSKLNWSQHISSVCARAAEVAKLLMRATRPTWGASPAVMHQLYVGALEPIVTYASCVWLSALRKDYNVRRLHAFQRPFLIRICRGYRTMPLISAQVLTGIIPIELRVKEVAALYQVRKSGISNIWGLNVECERSMNWFLLPHPASRDVFKVKDVGESCDGDGMFGWRIFTDGSCVNGRVGAAFVPYLDGDELPARAFRLAEHCSIFQAELFAIGMALLWAEENLPVNCGSLSIVTDSRSCLIGINDVKSVSPLIFRIRESVGRLAVAGTVVEFQWVRGHSGVIGNERADREARRAGCGSDPVSYDACPLAHVRGWIMRQMLSDWDALYKSAPQGGITKMFFPSVTDAARFRTRCEIGFELAQILTGHGAMKSYLLRFGLADSDACCCDGVSAQDVLHLLFECYLLEEFRWDVKEACELHGTVWSLNGLPEILDVDELAVEFERFVRKIVRTVVEWNSRI